MPNTQTADQALGHLLQLSEPPLVWMKDIDQCFSASVIRGLRDIYYRWQGTGSALFLSSPNLIVRPELEREMALINLSMPNQAEILDILAAWQEDHPEAKKLPAKLIAATLKGLTRSEIRHALTRMAHHPDEENPIRQLQEEKRYLIAKSGTLEYIPKVPELHELGGLENLKDWLKKRRELLLMGEEAKEITPKGILLMGVSGCGKSLCIKAISSAWQLPLYRMEMVKIFSGAHGSPEQAFADACRLMEEMAPAILWIDEIEMGLSAGGSTAVDPVMSRIFAFFLTWMQEKPSGLFVAATANRIDLLPAEMIRKGRFDQVFFVDLPGVGERRHIFDIHLKKRGYDSDRFNLDVFADGTEGWNGAEIEQCVIAAITSAAMEQRDLELKDMYAARKQIVPISTTMEEQVRHIRNWAYERAVKASADE
ncbi:AAA family ATPase [Sulfidibacter corallicola]